MENNENCVTQLKLHPSLSSSMAVCFIESSSILFNLLRWWRLAEFDLFDFFTQTFKAIVPHVVVVPERKYKNGTERDEKRAERCFLSGRRNVRLLALRFIIFIARESFYCH